jgi:uncharacterized protein (AIM24 family)
VQGCFGGEGLFVVEATGMGRMAVASYGSITRYDLQPGEKRKVDNGYVVCWASDMRWAPVQALAWSDHERLPVGGC